MFSRSLYVGRQIRDRTLHIIAGVAKSLPRNAEVAEQFDLLADFLELEGSDQFRPLAYRRAAQRMRETGGSIAQLAVEGKAKVGAIHIHDGGNSHIYDGLDKVPERYRDKVQNLVESSEKIDIRTPRGWYDDQRLRPNNR